MDCVRKIECVIAKILFAIGAQGVYIERKARPQHFLYKMVSAQFIRNLAAGKLVIQGNGTSKSPPETFRPLKTVEGRRTGNDCLAASLRESILRAGAYALEFDGLRDLCGLLETKSDVEANRKVSVAAHDVYREAAKGHGSKDQRIVENINAAILASYPDLYVSVPDSAPDIDKVRAGPACQPPACIVSAARLVGRPGFITVCLARLHDRRLTNTSDGQSGTNSTVEKSMSTTAHQNVNQDVRSATPCTRVQ